jgi:hypothetical protein
LVLPNNSAISLISIFAKNATVFASAEKSSN